MASSDLFSHYSDVYKSYFGFRPQFTNLSEVSDAELYDAIEELGRDLEAETAHEAHEAMLAAEASIVAALYDSEPLPYEDYDI